MKATDTIEPSESTPRRTGLILRFSAGLGIIATVVLAVALADRFGRDPTLVSSPLIGQPAPAFELPALDGPEQIALSDMRGQVVVVNFWASWCLACRAEHDDLTSTAAAFEDRGVVFVGVDYQDDPQSAVAFLDELGWGSNYSYLEDAGSRTAIAYGVFGVPETFFIDREGVVVGKITGESNAMLLGSTLDQILAGKQPGEHTAGTVQSSADG